MNTEIITNLYMILAFILNVLVAIFSGMKSKRQKKIIDALFWTIILGFLFAVLKEILNYSKIINIDIKTVDVLIYTVSVGIAGYVIFRLAVFMIDKMSKHKIIKNKKEDLMEDK